MQLDTTGYDKTQMLPNNSDFFPWGTLNLSIWAFSMFSWMDINVHLSYSAFICHHSLVQVDDINMYIDATLL